MKGTHRIAILLTAFAVLLGLAPGSAAAADSRGDTKVANIAHRGSGAMAPENTLASVRLALQQGADYIENDIMRTKRRRAGDHARPHPGAHDRRRAGLPRRGPGTSWTSPSPRSSSSTRARGSAPRMPGSASRPCASGSRPSARAPACCSRPRTRGPSPASSSDIDKELRSIPAFIQALRVGPGPHAGR